jgi:hypothetical protein
MLSLLFPVCLCLDLCQILFDLQLRVQDHPRAPEPLHALPVRAPLARAGARCFFSFFVRSLALSQLWVSVDVFL